MTEQEAYRLWAEKLRAKYGIAKPIDDGDDGDE